MANMFGGFGGGGALGGGGLGAGLGGGFSTGAPAAQADPNASDVIVDSPPEDTVTSLHWSQAADMLLASSWAGDVRVWNVAANGQTQGVAAFKSDATSTPILSARFAKSGAQIAAGVADGTVLLYDLQSQQQRALGKHDAAVRHVRWFDDNPNSPILITGSWDKTVRYWDLRSPQPIGTLQVGERVYAMDNFGQMLVVGTAERKVHMINLAQPGQIAKTIDSPLKYQLRVITCFPKDNCFALASIEGRCAFQYADEKNKGDNFSFKCHRTTPTTPGAQPQIYAVNDIAMHPYGTFATIGSDGAMHFWDKDARTRLKMLPSAGRGVSLTCAAFSRGGNLLAYAAGYDWSKGHQHAPQPGQGKPVIRLHAVQEADIKPRPPKAKR